MNDCEFSSFRNAPFQPSGFCFPYCNSSFRGESFHSFSKTTSEGIGHHRIVESVHVQLFFYPCVRGGVCARMCNLGVYTCQKMFLGTYSINFCLIHLRQNVSPQSIICKRLGSHLLDSCIEKWLDNEGPDTLSAYTSMGLSSDSIVGRQ